MNGNDLIEFEEAHRDSLEVEFLIKHADKFSEFCANDYEIVEKFINKNDSSWNEFVRNEYNNRGF